MSELKYASAGLFYRVAATGLLPVSWFRDVDPDKVVKAKRTGKLNLEIVSHCWRYGHFLTYQLSSLVNNRTDKFDITMTVYYSPNDEAVTSVLAFFENIDVPGVTWNWQPLSRNDLFRRGIGRNRAAKATVADWIWFTDCDIIFGEGCLETLADLLQGRDDGLVHAGTVLGTALLAEDDEILTSGREGPAVREIPVEKFRPYGGQREKAQGPHQITHGDIARACGYCDSIRYYQTPSDVWRKTYEDRAFRWLIGTHGAPLEIPNVCQIRHIAKGRYKQDAFTSKVRRSIRERRG